jgi:hypothetical protein
MKHLLLTPAKVIETLGVHEANCSGEKHKAAYDDKPLLESL